MFWIFAACLAIPLAASGPARAGMVWGTADTISGDSDVSDAGTLLDAIDFNTSSTVNGTLFTGITTSTTADTTGTETVVFDGYFNSYSAPTYLNAAQLRQVAPALSGSTQTWNPNGDFSGGDGTWDTGLTPNWDAGAVWSDSDDALFTGTGGGVTVAAPTANALTFSASGSYLLTGGTLTMSGSNIVVNSDATIGSDITVSAAGLLVTGSGTLTLTGSDNFGGATLDVEGGTLGIQNSLSNGIVEIGNNGGSNGSVMVSGTWSTGNAVIGNNASSDGAVTVSGSGAAWNISGSFTIGNSGTGTLTISNGGLVSDGGVTIGYLGAGSVTVTGTGSIWTNSGGLTVGRATGSLPANLTISGGGYVSDSGATIGSLGGTQNSVTVTGSGSTWNNTGGLTIANSGAAGSLTVMDGGKVLDTGATIASTSNPGGGSVTVTGAGSTWTNTGSVDMGAQGRPGALTISAGGGVSDTGADVGVLAHYTSTVTISDSGSIWTNTGSVTIGDMGGASLSISGGGIVTDTAGVVAENLYLGEQAATVSGSGSEWTNSGSLTIGASGIGSLSISSGASLSDTTGIIGENPHSQDASTPSTVTISGSGGVSTWTNSSDLYIGESGVGTLQIISGGVVSSSNGWIGYAAGSNGMVTVDGTGSQWNLSGGLYLGEAGSASLNISDGGAVSVSGQSAAGGATAAGELYVGGTGAGSLSISSGAAVSDSNAWIGYTANSSGMVTVDGSGAAWTNSGILYVGESGSGSLSITNGALVSSSGGGIIGDQAGSSGIVTVDGTGSHWNLSGGLYLGESGSASLVISEGGAVSVSGQSAAGGATAGGELYVGGTGGGSSLSISSSSGAVSSAVVSNSDAWIGYAANSSGMVTVDGSEAAWTNSGSLYIGYQGAGTLAISNGGLVDVTGSTTAGASGAGTIAFGENATLTGNVIADPGSTVTLVAGQVHTISLSGSAQVNAGTTLDFEVGNGSDQLAVPGGLGLSGASIVNLYGLSGQVTSGTDVLITASPSVGGGSVALGNVYNTGNFTYTLKDTGTSENVIVAAATPLTTAYWTGAQNNIWSVAVGGSNTNWSTDPAGANDPGLTPSATTDVIFSASNAVNQSSTVLGSDMTIDSLTISDTNAISISGSDSQPLMPDNDTLTITGSNSGGDAIAVNAGAGQVTISANLLLGGSSQNVTVNNTAGLLLTGTVSGSNLDKDGAGTLTLAGPAVFSTGTVDVEYGTLAVQNTLSDGFGYVGNQATSSGAVTVSGTGSSWTNTGDLYIGNSGAGSLLITNGATVSSNSGYIAASPGSTGMVTVSGTGSSWSTNGNLLVGGDQGQYSQSTGGTALLIVTNGASISPGLLNVFQGGTLVFGDNAALNTFRSVNVDGGILAIGQNVTWRLNSENLFMTEATLTLVDGQLNTFTLPGVGENGIDDVNYDLEVGNGSDEVNLAYSGGYQNTLNLYGLSGLVSSGTDVLLENVDHLESAPVLGNIYNTGNFSYSLQIVPNSDQSNTDAELIVTATTPLTTAYWTGAQNNIWSVAVGGSNTNWSTDPGGANDPGLTPSATTDVIFSASNAVNQSSTVLGSDMTIDSLTISDTNAVSISGSDSQPLMPDNDTLTITGSNSGGSDITVNSGAGQVTISANLFLGNSSQNTVTVNNAAGLLLTGTLGGSGMTLTGTGALTLAGPGNFGGGTVDVEGGALAIQNTLFNDDGYIGEQAGTNGAVTVSGSGSTWTNSGDLYVAESGTGALTISGGAVVVDKAAFVDVGSGSGMVTVSGSGSTWSNVSGVEVGNSGSGSLVITSGGTVSDSSCTIGVNFGSGTATVSGSGSWTNTGALGVGGEGAGTLAISGGGAVSDLNGLIGAEPGATGGVTVNGSGSSWTNSEELYVGYSGSGSLSISGGALVTSGSGGIIGDQTGSIGIVTVDGSGGASTWTDEGELYVGESGSGSLSITNGAMVSSGNGGIIGDQTGSIGIVTVDGSGGASTWTNEDDLLVGGSGSGTLSITTGGSVSSRYAFIGDKAGSNGVVTVDGATSSLTASRDVYVADSGNGMLAVKNSGQVSASGDIYVGDSGTGTLTVSSGGSLSNGYLFIGGVIGNNGGSAGSVTVDGAGSSWTDSSGLYVANSGSGTLTVSDGATVGNGYKTTGPGAGKEIGGAVIGNNGGSIGSVTINGAGSSWTDSGDLYIANSGSGSMTISNGGYVENGILHFGASIARNPGSIGSVTVTGSGSTWTDAGDLYVGNSGLGTLTISSGGLVSDSNGWIGFAAGAYGVVSVTGSGSTWADSGNLAIGGSGFGALVMTGGGLVNVTGATTVGSTGALEFDGGSTLDTGSLVVGGGALYALSAGTFANSATIGSAGMSVNTEGFNSTFSGDFSGPGRIVKYGAGALTLTGSNSIGGSLWIDGFGGVQISGSGLFSDASGIIGNGGSNTMSVTGSDSQWTNTDELFVGYTGAGTLEVANEATVLTDSNAYLGYGAHSSGTAIVSGGSLWENSGILVVGGSGPGILAVTSAGGVIANENSYIGLDAGSQGLVQVSGVGNWENLGNLAIGYSGYGTFQVTGGSGASSDGDVYIGLNAGSKGMAVVSGSTSLWTISDDLLVACSGTGTAAINGGGNVEDADGYIGLNAGSNGSVTVSGSGSSWSSTGIVVIGDAGQGLLAISGGGGVSSGENSYIGVNAGSNGSVAVSGSGSTLTISGNLAVGYSGTGALAMTGGGAVLSEEAGYIGYNAGSNGSVIVSGSGSQWTTSSNLAVGYSGTGTLLVNNGGDVTSEGNDYIGYNAGSEGIVKISGSGSTWTNAQGLVIGSLGEGVLSVVNGAQVSVTGATMIGSAGGLEFDGASTFTTGSLVINGGALATLGAATFTPSVGLGPNGARVNTDGFNSTFSGNFYGSGGLTKVGSGVATLTAASTYAGATNINGGTLALTTGAAQTASLGNTAITVASGATFAATLGASPFSNVITAGSTGSGTAGATLTLDPGSTFSMAGASLASFYLHQENSFSGPAFTIGGASGIAPSLIFEIGNANAGTDLLHFNSTVDVLATGGDITIDALAGDTSLTAGNYDLIATAGGFSGTAGNGLFLSGTTLAISGTTYDLSLAQSTTSAEILTVSEASTPSTPSTPESSLTAFDASPPDLTAPAPPIQTASVPEPSAAGALLTALALAAASRVPHRKSKKN